MAKYRQRPYTTWKTGGWLTVTDGNITDYDQVEADIIALCQTSGIREVAYDKHSAQQMALHLEGKGITCVDTPQGFGLNEALNNVADIAVTGRLVHDGNPIMDWHAANAVVRKGTRGDIRLDKERASDKIDGIAALVMANSRAIVQMDMASVYDDRGVVVF